MSLDQIASFIEHCRIQRGLSANSLRAYKQDLEAFNRYKLSHWPDCETSGTIILEFTTFLRDTQSLSISTIRRRLLTIRAYFCWLAEARPNMQSPFEGLDIRLKIPRRLPKPIDRPTLSHLFRESKRITSNAADTLKPSNPTTIDHQQVTGLVVRLLLSTGLRIGEITHVRISDVSNGGTCIRVDGKGARERTVYVSNKNLLTDLNAYIELRRRHVSHGDYLFLNRRGTRLSEPAFRKRLRAVSRDLQISPHLTPHKFRHSAATMLIEEGVDIRVVQRLLGHASIATTEIYTKVSDNSLMSAIRTADTLSKVESYTNGMRF